MYKKILIPLDKSKLAPNVLKIGTELAQKFNSTLEGISIIDTKGISKSSSGAGPGAGSFAKKLEKDKLDNARHIAQELINQFEDSCRRAGVAYSINIMEGDPSETILCTSELSDLVLLGIRTNFKYETQDLYCDTFEKVVQKCSVPVFAVSEDTVSLDFDSIVAYDGSIKAKHVLRSFAPFYDVLGKNYPLKILYVGKNDSKTISMLREATNYLKTYNIKTETLIKQGKPRQVIFESTKELDNKKNTILIIGTNGKNELTDYLFGSSIKK